MGEKPPWALNSTNEIDAVFASGVFCKIAAIVAYRRFEGMIPDRFSKFYLSTAENELATAKVWYPKTGFRDDTEAVDITKDASDVLSRLHDNFLRNLSNDPEFRQIESRFTGRHGLDRA